MPKAENSLDRQHVYLVVVVIDVFLFILQCIIINFPLRGN